MNYAQIDENGVCVAVIEDSEVITQDDFIPIEGDPISYMGRTYTDGVWSGDAYIPETFTEDEYAEMTYINSEYTVALLEILMARG